MTLKIESYSNIILKIINRRIKTFSWIYVSQIYLPYFPGIKASPSLTFVKYLRKIPDILVHFDYYYYLRNN